MKNLFLVLFFSTFVSEDITCITAGIFAKEGKLSLVLAILFTGFGIFIGDLLLYLVGYSFHTYLKQWKRIERWEKKLSSQKIYKQWKSNFVFSILISRFLPGTRLPLYLLSGYFRMPFVNFMITSFIAVTIWTTAFVTLVYLYGKWISSYFFNFSHWWGFISIGLSFYLIFQLFLLILIPEKRSKLFLQCQKFTKLEFWPSYLFYLPLVPYLFYLILKYRGIRYLTTTNPGIIASGIAGESKSEILNLIPNEYVAKSLLLKEGDQKKIQAVTKWMKQKKLDFPIIAKPDKGERGFLVKKIQSISELEQLFQTYTIDWLLQEWMRGPYEVGIFYYRNPDEPHGNIFSITDKVFPKITGDGISTLETLIQNHPRYRFQWESHKKHNQRFLQNIIPKGKSIFIGTIGNHIQGCMFQDGEHLRTSKLEKQLIRIGDKTKGFFFGRFDIRYSQKKDLLEGKGFKIIELNGVTSESTNLYDPKFSIRQSYSILFRQWKLIFEIGYKNHSLGIPFTPYQKIFQLIGDHNDYRKKFSLLETNL